jgi:glycosidase
VDNPKVLAFTRTYKDETLLVVVNLSKYAQPALEGRRKRAAPGLEVAYETGLPEFYQLALTCMKPDAAKEFTENVPGSGCCIY